jgi:hypothetical protein
MMIQYRQSGKMKGRKKRGKERRKFRIQEPRAKSAGSNVLITCLASAKLDSNAFLIHDKQGQALP